MPSLASPPPSPRTFSLEDLRCSRRLHLCTQFGNTGCRSSGRCFGILSSSWTFRYPSSFPPDNPMFVSASGAGCTCRATAFFLALLISRHLSYTCLNASSCSSLPHLPRRQNSSLWEWKRVLPPLQLAFASRGLASPTVRFNKLAFRHSCCGLRSRPFCQFLFRSLPMTP